MSGAEDAGVEELADVAEELRDSVRDLQARISFNKTWNIVLTTLLALKFVTIVVLVFVIMQLYHTQDSAAATRHRVWCPLYALLVDQVEQPRHPEETDSQYAIRSAAKQQILDSYKFLRCP